MTWLRHILVGTLRQKVIKGILLDLASALHFAQGLKMHGECNRKKETCTEHARLFWMGKQMSFFCSESVRSFYG